MSILCDVSCHTLLVFHKKYIQNTLPRALVQNQTMFLCNLTRATMLGCNLNSQKVYVSTKTIKHLYDKRTAVLYFFIINNLHKIIKFPDKIYQNKSGKRGELGFIKIIDKTTLFVSAEIIQENIFVVTTFEVKESYLKNFTLIWSWRSGTSSS